MNMRIENKLFELKGIICFEGDPEFEQVDDNSIVHYKSYLLVNNKWTLFDGLPELYTTAEPKRQDVPVEDKIALIIFATTR